MNYYYLTGMRVINAVNKANKLEGTSFGVGIGKNEEINSVGVIFYTFVALCPPKSTRNGSQGFSRRKTVITPISTRL